MADDLLSRLGASPQSAVRPAQDATQQGRQAQPNLRPAAGRTQSPDVQGIIPAPETLRSLIANAIESQRNGFYLDRGSLLNIVV